MAKSYASSTTIPLAVIPNPMREMAFRKVDAVKRDADREARRASSSISTLPQMGWSKENRLDLAQGVTPKPGRAPVARPFPEPQGDRSSFLNGLRRGPR
jgi:hypothetical protein